MLRVLDGLITEARETKVAIDDAYVSISNANQLAHHNEHKVIEEQKDSALEKNDLFETSLFGYDSASRPTEMTQPTAVVPSMSFETSETLQSATQPAMQKEKASRIETWPQKPA